MRERLKMSGREKKYEMMDYLFHSRICGGLCSIVGSVQKSFETE